MSECECPSFISFLIRYRLVQKAAICFNLLVKLKIRQIECFRW